MEVNSINRNAAAGMIRGFALALCLALVTALFPLRFARAQDAAKTVRVGWYESAFNMTDQFGRRSGYAYEYQMKIASYSGWKYEYVVGSWPDLMEMLLNGELDMLSDVSYTPERDGKMLYPSLPMGTEEYYLFVAPGNTEITPADYSTLNGKRVGANRGSIQAACYEEWAERNGSGPSSSR